MQKHIVGPGETVHISMERKSVTAKSHLAKFRLQRKFSLTPLPEKAFVTEWGFDSAIKEKDNRACGGT